MQVAWLLLAIVATVGYHLVLKVTPSAVDPFLSLAGTYAVVTLVMVAAYALAPGGEVPARAALRALNWTVVGLAAAIVFLDLGFLLLYRTGFDVSLGQLVTQSGAALILLGLGVVLFKERLNFANLAGIALCVVGLWLIHRK
jgi:multidrug transporter EmrE-like cation transporter